MEYISLEINPLALKTCEKTLKWKWIDESNKYSNLVNSFVSFLLTEHNNLISNCQKHHTKQWLHFNFPRHTPRKRKMNEILMIEKAIMKIDIISISWLKVRLRSYYYTEYGYNCKNFIGQMCTAYYFLMECFLAIIYALPYSSKWIDGYQNKAIWVEHS